MGDRAGEGKAYGYLGTAYHDLGDFQKAMEYHKRYFDISKEVGDRAGEGRAYGNLGNDYYSLADFQKVIECHEQLLKISKEVGDKVGEGRAYGYLGNIHTYIHTYTLLMLPKWAFQLNRIKKYKYIN